MRPRDAIERRPSRPARLDALEPEALDHVLAPFGEARPLPLDAYLAPEVLAFERRAFFEEGWLCVGHEQDVAEPGAWVRTPLPRVIVARGEDGALRALIDVCRHRGATLLEGERGFARSLTCPYHGWVYAPSGALRAAPDAPEGFDGGAHGLCRAEVEVFAGLLFVRRRPSKGALGDALGDVPAFVPRANLHRLRVGHRACWETGANWKLVVENFQEAHHFPHVHPGLERWTPARASSSIHGDGPWFCGEMRLVDDAETVSRDGRLRGRPFVTPAEDRRVVFDAHLFPSLLLSVQPDYALVYRLFPLAVDRTRVDFAILVDPGLVDPGLADLGLVDSGLVDRGARALDDVVDHWTQTNAEDRDVCERQQRGLAAGVGPGCYTRSEDGVHAFDRLVARRYLEALEREGPPRDAPPRERDPARREEAP